MAVPTLPVIGVAPPVVLFETLWWLTYALVMAFYVGTLVSFCVLVHPVLQALLYCGNKCCRTPRQRQHGCCCRCMKAAFLAVGRWLCVNTFPALFKMHKTRSRHGNQTRKFMVFLDRKVESSVVLIAAFYSLACSILCISTLVFFRYFPVEVSGECLELDSTYGRPHFCYVNSSITKNPSLPVDCANYTVTELREIEFTCFAIAFPGLGIAVAAALGFTKVATVGVTVCVKVTEAFFNMTKNPPQKLPQWCCCCKLPRIYANKIYIYLCWALLTIMLAVSPISIIIFKIYDETQHSRSLSLRRYYYAYMLLPALVSVPLMYIIKYLEAHCDREEYISITADQRPLDQRDWDVESGSSVTEGQQGKTSRQGENSSINGEAPDGNEETVLIEARGNTEYAKHTKYGATQH